MNNETNVPTDSEATAPPPRRKPEDRPGPQEGIGDTSNTSRSGEKSATEQYEDADLEERTPG